MAAASARTSRPPKTGTRTANTANISITSRAARASAGSITRAGGRRRPQRFATRFTVASPTSNARATSEIRSPRPNDFTTPRSAPGPKHDGRPRCGGSATAARPRRSTSHSNAYNVVLLIRAARAAAAFEPPRARIFNACRRCHVLRCRSEASTAPCYAALSKLSSFVIRRIGEEYPAQCDNSTISTSSPPGCSDSWSVAAFADDARRMLAEPAAARPWSAAHSLWRDVSSCPGRGHCDPEPSPSNF
jgi:hypothetical protein